MYALRLLAVPAPVILTISERDFIFDPISTYQHSNSKGSPGEIVGIVNGNKTASRFSSTVYRSIIALLAAVGMATALELAVSHYRNFSDVGYQSFCAVSRALNCDTVAQSPYAIFMGVPLAIWGVVGYLLFLSLIVFFSTNKKMLNGWGVLFALSLLLSLTSLVLAIISSVRIHSYCLMCMVTYSVNFGLLFFSWLAFRRFGQGTSFSKLKNDLAYGRKRLIKVAIGVGFFMSLSIALLFLYPDYWHFKELSLDSEGIAQGITDDGCPWIGSRHPRLTIVEFTDYLCFQCGKMHSHLRQLIAKYPDRIRLVHRHFPLDRQVNPLIKETVHANSGLLSLFALFAEQSGCFWQVNDRLLKDAREKQSINLGEVAKETGLDITAFQNSLNGQQLFIQLGKDIKAGAELGIVATPSYLIDGKHYSGMIPAAIIAQAIKGE